jgi:hypothetical protein
VRRRTVTRPLRADSRKDGTLLTDTEKTKANFPATSRNLIGRLTSTALSTSRLEVCCANQTIKVGVVGGGADGSENYLHRLIDIAMFRVLHEAENLATGIVNFDGYPEFELSVSTKIP